MPALLLALGSAFGWIVRYAMTLLASEVVRKAMLFITFNIVIGILLSWIGTKLGIDPFSLGSSMSGWLGSVPAFVLWVLDAFGFITALWIVVQVQLSIFGVRLLMRALGAGGRS